MALFYYLTYVKFYKIKKCTHQILYKKNNSELLNVTV